MEDSIIARNMSSENQWLMLSAASNDTHVRLDPIKFDNSSNAVDIRTRGPQMSPDLFMILIRDLRMYYTPAIISLGILGNTITWMIFLKSRLRLLSSSHYLAATVMVNTLYLVSLLIQWMSLFGLDIYNQPRWCQFVNFVSRASAFLSVWYLTAFAVDRYICICWPSEAAKMCTRTRARLVIISLLCIAIVVYINISLTVGVIVYKGKPRCTPLPMFMLQLRILEILDMFVNLALPYLTIMILTLLIVYNSCTNRNLSHNPAQIRSVTIVFLCSCLLFHLPNELFRVIYTVQSLLRLGKSPPSSVTYFVQAVLQHTFHTSLAIHFFLFVACYRVFRTISLIPFSRCYQKILQILGIPQRTDHYLPNVQFHEV